MNELISEISRCTVCQENLAHEPRPVVVAHPLSKIIIIGQAPGAVVHRTGIPWDDLSGKNLRNWMGVDEATFYDEAQIALVPMGFCYPGKGKSGDLPPRKECAPLWHERLFQPMQSVELVLLIGKYAQDYYLPDMTKATLTATVKNYQAYLPKYFVLPHPSPRNNIWQARNPWFGTQVLPDLKKYISKTIPLLDRRKGW